MLIQKLLGSWPKLPYNKMKKLLISANSEAWAVFKDILRKSFKDSDHMLITCHGQEHLQSRFEARSYWMGTVVPGCPTASQDREPAWLQYPLLSLYTFKWTKASQKEKYLPRQKPPVIFPPSLYPLRADNATVLPALQQWYFKWETVKGRKPS